MIEFSRLKTGVCFLKVLGVGCFLLLILPEFGTEFAVRVGTYTRLSLARNELFMTYDEICQDVHERARQTLVVGKGACFGFQSGSFLSVFFYV